MLIGYGNGFFQRVFYDEDIKLPLALIAGSEFLYGMVIYVLLFMLKSDFHFLHYLRHVIMPELVYTILVTLVLYQIILHINRRLEEEEKRSAKTLWVLFILGLVNAVMYCFPYIRYVFYDQQIAAMGITNTQSGILMTIYAAANTITLIPGGILADKWSVKKCLVGSILGSVVIGIIYALTMNFAVACVLWAGLGVSTIFVFWAAITKAVGQVGTAEEQGMCYGIYYAASGIISAILNAVCLQVSRLSDEYLFQTNASML